MAKLNEEEKEKSITLIFWGVTFLSEYEIKYSTSSSRVLNLNKTEIYWAKYNLFSLKQHAHFYHSSQMTPLSLTEPTNSILRFDLSPGFFFTHSFCFRLSSSFLKACIGP